MQDDGTWYYIGETTPVLVETGASVTDAATGAVSYPASSFDNKVTVWGSGACYDDAGAAIGFNWALLSIFLIIVLLGVIGFGVKHYSEKK